MEETMKEERPEDEQNHDCDVNNIDPGGKQIKHDYESTEIGAQIELYKDSHSNYIGNSALPSDIEKKGLHSDSIEPKSRESLLLLGKPKEYSLEGELEKHELDEKKASEHNSEEVASPVEEDYCDNRAEDEFVGISGNSLYNNGDAKFENEKIDDSDMDVQRLHSVADNNSNYVMANNEGYNHQNESNTLAEVENGDAVYISETFGNRKLEIVRSDIDEMETKTLGEKEGFSTAEAAQEGTLLSTSHKKAENALSPAEALTPNSDTGSPLIPASARTGLPVTEDDLAPNAADKKIFVSSPRPSMRRHSPSQGNHNLSRKRASSRELTSPSIRCRTPSGMASGSHHRDHSHNKNSSPERKEPALERKPDFHRGDRSASDTRRRESSRKELSRSPRRRKSPSAWMSDPHQRDRSPRKQLSPSRRVESPRKKGRLASRSPLRKGVASGSKRDSRRRSRSRSPKDRDRYRRSPRRYSPRRKSPVAGYPSRRHSPKRAWSPPANRSTGIGRPGRNLFVAGFSYITTERDLEKKFSRFGRVTDIRIVRDKRSGESRGFGFLSLERDEDADAAIRALDQTEWNGRIVLVEKSKTPVR